jgi:hypothetical protein
MFRTELVSVQVARAVLYLFHLVADFLQLRLPIGRYSDVILASYLEEDISRSSPYL